MRVEVTESFKWSPDGNEVRTVEAGAVVEGEPAAIAMLQGKGRQVEERAPRAEFAEEPAAAAAVEPDPTTGPNNPHQPQPVEPERPAEVEERAPHAAHSKPTHKPAPKHKR